MPVASMTLAMLSRCLVVMKSFRPNAARKGIASVITIANPEKIAPATKNGGKIVECQPGRMAIVKSKRHDRVHRDDQRCRQPRQQQIGRPVAMPVPGRASPAHRQEPVDILRPAVLGPVPERRQVGDQPDIPEQERHRGVRGNGKHVPHQRAAPLRPEPHRVRIRHQPVEEPGPPHVEQREKPRAGDGKQASSPRRID